MIIVRSREADRFQTLNTVALFLSVGVLAFIFSLTSRVTPWADEWYMNQLTSQTRVEQITWLFTQHNDHLMPIQKAIQRTLLLLAGYDFRVLLPVNITVMVLCAFLLLHILRLFRGRSSFLDLAVVFSLCCVAPNTVIWSSTFAFPATNLAICAFTYAWIRQVKLGRQAALQYFTFVALISDPFISGGGLVATTALVVALEYVYRTQSHVPMPFPRPYYFAAWVIVLTGWVMYRPSGATGFDLANFPAFFVGLGGGSVFFLNWPYETVKDVIATAAILLTLLIVLFKLRPCNEHKAVMIPIAVMFVAVFAVYLSVSVGRSAYTAWYSWLKVHYGIVTAPLLPLAIVILSEYRGTRALIAFLFLCLAVSYFSSIKQQASYLRSVRPTNLAALHRLAHTDELEKAIAENWLDYWWRDSDTQLTADLANRVRFIRESGAELYRPWVPSSR